MKKFLQSVTLLLAVLMSSMTITASAEAVRGDVNGDTFINISDAIALINYISTGNDAGIDMVNANCNLDTEVNISDVIALINYLSTNMWPDTPVVDENYVDLGLPSGTLWATRNVGAENPEDCGDYFAWGETEPKDYYHASTYIWCNVVDGKIKLTKYCNKAANGYEEFTDDKLVLDPEDDAARANYPNGQMPSPEQLDELIQNCTWEWTQVNGMNGQMITGPNGNTMFLPATGYRSQSKVYSVGTHGSYWLNCISDMAPLNGRKIYVASGTFNINSSSRQLGYTVRAVRATEE
jgi:hypothetical protein